MESEPHRMTDERNKEFEMVIGVKVKAEMSISVISESIKDIVKYIHTKAQTKIN